MRWVIAALLLANLIVFLWWNADPDRRSASSREPLPDLGSLRLVTEADPGIAEPALAGTRTTNTEARPADAAEIFTPTQQVAPEGADEHLGQQEGIHSPLSAQDTLVGASAASTTSGADADEERHPQTVCWEVGPFEDEAQIATLRLPEALERLATRSTPVEVPTGYYVLIPAQQDQDAAHVLVRRLKDKGVTDFWLFKSGPLKNAISLGMFSHESNARRRAAEIAKLGFVTELRRRTRTIDGVTWLLRGPASKAVERGLHSGTAGKVRRIPCPEGESP